MLRNWYLWAWECKGVENGTTAGRVHPDALQKMRLPLQGGTEKRTVV